MQPVTTSTYDLDTPLLTFNKEGDTLTARQAVEGIQIFGGIGSGKTSGSGRSIARKFLKEGYGGLVLTVKPDECALWQQYAQETGRLDDLIIIRPHGQHHFDFLDYEANRSGIGAGLTDNVVMVLNTVIKAAQMEGGGGSNDEFWDNALDMLLTNLVDLCLLGTGKLSIDTLNDMARSLPDERTLSRPDYEKWKEQSVFYQTYLKARQNIENDESLGSDKAAMLLLRLDQFFFDEFGQLNERTRSIVLFSLTGLLFRLSRDPVYSLFCNNDAPTFSPEDSLQGKIIILDLPVKMYDKVGRDAQVLFKYVWQRAMERRDLSDNDRLVFLWADEAQNFLHHHDIDYQATARSSRVCTVYLTQNMPNYLAHIGGGKTGEYLVQSFLGTLATKVFHANADYQTNEYASKLIGQHYRIKASRQSTYGESMSLGTGESEELAALIRPEEFVNLKTGGPDNDYIVSAYMHRQGRPFKAKSINTLHINFTQKSTP
ncbi:MAG: TraM recognition domain-containing protein [Cyclobacteriaceae bacterium]